ncbi:hypothetical protein CLV71_112190 [Actinophytocola oryzae]|uniref:Uncharacterized protein n=1 Tax=Actinophytocola oryzae TaxID=502181 RepID=A0A4V3FRZ8_9PSEU|nr:hypothetical protein CLV71_112190 [Actinophytocola oryzae]
MPRRVCSGVHYRVEFGSACPHASGRSHVGRVRQGADLPALDVASACLCSSSRTSEQPDRKCTNAAQLAPHCQATDECASTAELAPAALVALDARKRLLNALAAVGQKRHSIKSLPAANAVLSRAAGVRSASRFPGYQFGSGLSQCARPHPQVDRSPPAVCTGRPRFETPSRRGLETPGRACFPDIARDRARSASHSILGGGPHPHQTKKINGRRRGVSHAATRWLREETA